MTGTAEAVAKWSPKELTDPPAATPYESLRAYLMSRRQSLLIELGALEDTLGLARTKAPKHERY